MGCDVSAASEMVIVKEGGIGGGIKEMREVDQRVE